MEEAATNNMPEEESVSDFEFILPWEVIETCCSLKTNGSSCFVSVNQQNNTENRLYVSKLEDNSIKIKIAISALPTAEVSNGEREERVEEQLDQILHQDESGIINLNQNDHNHHHDNHGGDDSSHKGLPFEGYNENLSTVIIIKKIEGSFDSTTNGDDDAKSDHNTSRKADEMSEKSLSSSLTRSDNGKLNMINLLTNPEDESDILCELCFEPCENYQQLVSHIHKQHRDCTFVRNYLDDIKTLTFSHCPHCRKEFMAKSSLDAHVKVTHGGQMSKSKLSPLIQQFNINKQELTYSRTYNKQYFANKINNSTTTPTTINTTPTTTKNDPKVVETPLISLERHERPVLDHSDDNSSVELNGRHKCEVCDESFDTRQQAIRHQNRTHRPSQSDVSDRKDGSFKCNYCQKMFESKERLLKHCLKTHFRSVEDMPMRRKRGAATGGGGGADDDDDDDDDDDAYNEIAGDSGGDGGDDDRDDASEFEDGVMEEEMKATKAKRGKVVVKKKKIQLNTTNKSTKNNKKAAKQNSSNNSSRSISPTLSNASSKVVKGDFICNLCGADFNRMTLLVTHARYCRQKCN